MGLFWKVPFQNEIEKIRKLTSYTFRLLLLSSIRITSSNDKLNRSALPDFSVLWLMLTFHDSLLLRISPFVRSHGISHRSFLVYLPNLRIRVTVAFLDFVTLGPLIRRIRLNIGFLFVRLRFCYPFLSPTPHDVNLGSRFGVRRQLRPLWTFTTDRRHARRTKKDAQAKWFGRLLLCFFD